MKTLFTGVVILFSTLVSGTLAAAALDIQTWHTTNGARVVFVPAPEIPMIDMRVVFAAGSARDGATPGLANLANALLEEGAGELDADAFSSALGATGAVIRSGAERDMAYATLRTLSDPAYVDRALALFVAAVAQPRFDADALERVRARVLIGLEHKTQSPAEVAEDAFFARVYQSHPYAQPPDGTAATVAELDRDAVVAFHKRYYVAKNAVISLVGAIDTARARAFAETLSSALAAGEPASALPDVAPTEARTERVEFPSIQSHVRVGLPGIRRGDPDYFPLLVGNHALGGNSLVSILFREIRGERGLSYSAYSYFAPMAQPGPFVAVLQTDRAQEAEALNVLNDTIRSFVNDGPPAADLTAAKQNLIGGFPLRIGSNAQIAEYIAMIAFYDLPLDYLATFTAKVAAVTADDVKAAFARHVALDELVTVVVGRRAAPAATPGS
jgi:zinc protease